MSTRPWVHIEGERFFFTMSLPLIWCTVLKPFINFTSTYWPGATRLNFGMRMRTETSTLQWVLTAKKKYLLFRQSYFRSVQGREKVIVDIIYYRLYLCTEWKLLGVEDVFFVNSYSSSWKLVIKMWWERKFFFSFFLKRCENVYAWKGNGEGQDSGEKETNFQFIFISIEIQFCYFW